MDMNIEYIEVNESFSTEYQTYIIGYCPDIDEFFVTNQRHFFWETENEFTSEEDGVEYFESHIEYFVGVKNEILSLIFENKANYNDAYLENTRKRYTV